MVKKLSISILLGILMVMPFQVFAARTDGGMWDQISNYIQTNCVGGCNVLVNGVSKYLNFGTVSGTNGYGFRDNAGTMQWKNSGGAWANIAAGGAGSQTPWTSDIDGAGYTLSNAYLTATATTLDLAGVTNSLVYANGIGRLTSIATTSLGLPTFSDLSSYLTISSWYATTTDGLDEGLTNLYFTNPRVLTYLNTLSKGYFWSTTSADVWEGTKSRWATTSADYWYTLQNRASSTLLGDNNSWTGGNLFIASTTIGGGTSFTGLTINGNSTTTGSSYHYGPGGANSTTYVSAKNSNDGSGHVGGQISLVSKGWGEAGIYIGDPTNDLYRYFFTAGGYTKFKGYTSGIQFVDNTINELPYMTISNSTRNVGIGTTSPYAKLSVVGETVGAYFTATTTSNNTFPNLMFTSATGTRLSLFSGACDSSTQKPVVDAVGNWSCGTDTSGGGASQWATSTLFSNMIHTAGAHGVGIGTTTPIGVLSLASSSAVTQWFNHTGASANKRLGYISWANGLFDFGTSSDAGATTSWLKMEEGTTTVSSPVLAVTNGGYTSRLIAGTGTSTLPGGINLQSGCLALNGTCLGTMALSGSIGQTQYYSGVNTAVGTSSLFIATSQNVGVGSTSPFAKLSVQGTAGLGTLFAVASSTNAQLFNIDHRGYVGIGSSTPWGVLSIIDPIGGSLFNPGVITATSTVDLPFFGWTASTSAAAGSEIRILAGNPSAYMSHGDSFDQLLINGRVNTGDWKQLECASDFNSKTAQITSDITGSVMSVALGKPCGDFSYIEDANGVADQVVTTGSGYVRLRPGATGATVVAGDGIGLAGTTAFLRHATNTPVMEATLRKGASQNASTSITMVGFSAATGVSANYATDAQDGCMFVASTTGNWKAVCRATTATIVDTGVASSSVTTGDGVFMKFRVELHNLNGTNYAVFRILQSKTASWQTVATINTNIPSGISLNPIVSIGKVSAGLSPELHVGRIRVWYNDPLWY